MRQTIGVKVRGVKFSLMGYTRSLELCARMNYETENFDFIDRMKPGETMYDLGSCEGRFSIYAALKGISVYSFEPEKRNYKVLVENLNLNSLLDSKVKIFNVAVGDDNRIGIIKVGQPWEGGHQKVVQHLHIRADLNFDFVEEQSIRIVSLDKFIKDEGLPLPNYLKIDIDGSEVPFLYGAEQTLKSMAIKGIIFELDKADNNYSGIVTKLNDLGFVMFNEYLVPNEKDLYNIIFYKQT